MSEWLSGGSRPVGICGHLQGENIQSYNLFSPVMMITWWRKPGGNLPPGHNALFEKWHRILYQSHRQGWAYTKTFDYPVTQTRLGIYQGLWLPSHWPLARPRQGGTFLLHMRAEALLEEDSNPPRFRETCWLVERFTERPSGPGGTPSRLGHWAVLWKLLHPQGGWVSKGGEVTTPPDSPNHLVVQD